MDVTNLDITERTVLNQAIAREDREEWQEHALTVDNAITLGDNVDSL